MRYESIGDIYSANGSIRRRLLAVLQGISAGEAAQRPQGEKWSIAEIVEHLAIVESGTLRICTKLVDAARAAGVPADGRVELNEDFNIKGLAIAGVKVEAPERVRPTGERSLDESVAQLEELRNQFGSFRSDLESYDLSAHTFPHPFFGELTAAEWMIVLGGHEARHTKQIEQVRELRNT